MVNFLPEELEEDTIGRMSPGDEGYTVPWAMFVDMDRGLWINREYSVDENEMGTCHMRIRMLENGTVCVYTHTIGDHKYSLGSDWVHMGVGLPVELV